MILFECFVFTFQINCKYFNHISFFKFQTQYKNKISNKLSKTEYDAHIPVCCCFALFQ